MVCGTLWKTENHQKPRNVKSFIDRFKGKAYFFYCYYFIMWDYVHTECTSQRGTLRPLNKLALPQSSAWIVPMECIHLSIGIYTCHYMPPFIYTDVHTYTNKHTYEHIHIHIHTHLNLSKHTYRHILNYTYTYLSANHTNDILSNVIFSSDWVI